MKTAWDTIRYASLFVVLISTGSCAVQNSLLFTYGLLPNTIVSGAEAEKDSIPEAKNSSVEGLALSTVTMEKLKPLPPEEIDTETLWLARCIYSETKKPEEQELVAWVVRNRVDTGYRGTRTYQEAVLDPYQFSAFNPDNPKRHHYLSLDRSSNAPGWQHALRIAYEVRHLPPQARPFSIKTRHFFSERSMPAQRHPNWAQRHKKVAPENGYRIDERRFRFYKDIS